MARSGRVRGRRCWPSGMDWGGVRGGFGGVLRWRGGVSFMVVGEGRVGWWVVGGKVGGGRWERSGGEGWRLEWLDKFRNGLGFVLMILMCIYQRGFLERV